MAQLIAALMRHGSYHQPEGVPSAHLPHPLTPQGEEEAKEGARALLREADERGWRLHDVIDSSTLLRAWQTAEIAADEIAEATGGRPEVATFDALTERSVGSAANLTVREIEDIVARDPRFPPLAPGWRANSDLRLPFPGAESLAEAGKRVARHLRDRMQEVARQADGGVVKLFVGHGGAFRHAAAALGVMSAAEARARSMYYGSVVFIEAMADGQWRHVAGAWKMRRSADERPN